MLAQLNVLQDMRFEAQLPSGGAAAMAILPARLYADSANYENAPILKNGTAYDARTGAWTDNGTTTSSSEANLNSIRMTRKLLVEHDGPRPIRRRR